MPDILKNEKGELFTVIDGKLYKLIPVDGEGQRKRGRPKKTDKAEKPKEKKE